MLMDRPLSGSPRGRLASADLFGQGDDDARGAAEVAEPEDALVLRHLAEEFGAVMMGTVRRHGLTDAAWVRIEPLPHAQPRQGTAGQANPAARPGKLGKYLPSAQVVEKTCPRFP